MSTTSAPPRPRRGPARAPGAPTGREEVRGAVLAAAAELFARRGVAAVSLRDIAAKADVHVSLINRYVGSREDLIRTVFDDLAGAVARFIIDHPREQHGFDPGSPLGQWLVILAHWMLTGQDADIALGVVNPVQAMADVIVKHNGLDPRDARVRAAQIFGSALGWRLFETYLVAAADLTGERPQYLHDELTAIHQRIGATPLDSEPHQPLERERARPT